MINYNNHNITGMSYNNHTIKKAYGCDGNLVWKHHGEGYINQYLTLIPRDDAEIYLTHYDNPCYYSFDSGSTWSEMLKDTPIQVQSGQKVMFKKIQWRDQYISFPVGTFQVTADYDAEGNVMSMVFGDDFYDKTDLTGRDSCLSRLFQTIYGGVVNIDNLKLPATTLSPSCYASMFRDGKMTTVPRDLLPATTMMGSCYSDMFKGCRNLTVAPDLPATTLAQECYIAMFQDCRSLTKSPVLPATSIEFIVGGVDTTKHCYQQMFYNCTNLNEITCLVTPRTEWSTENASEWVYGVSATGTFYKNPATDSLPQYYSGIPTGWTVQDAT